MVVVVVLLGEALLWPGVMVSDCMPATVVLLGGASCLGCMFFCCPAPGCCPPPNAAASVAGTSPSAAAGDAAASLAAICCLSSSKAGFTYGDNCSPAAACSSSFSAVPRDNPTQQARQGNSCVVLCFQLTRRPLHGAHSQQAKQVMSPRVAPASLQHRSLSHLLIIDAVSYPIQTSGHCEYFLPWCQYMACMLCMYMLSSTANDLLLLLHQA